MKRTTGRPGLRFKGTLLAGLLAVALAVLLGGCGQFNDNPASTNLSATVSFAGANQTTAASSSGCATDTLCSPDTADGGPVKMIIIGPIVIAAGHNKGSGTDGAWTSADIDNISETDRQNLIDDAKQSAQYVSLITLPNPDTVQFVIPPDGAGNWQLVAVGLNAYEPDLASVQQTEISWFGFIDHFLNGEIQPGGTLSETLTLQPYCVPNGPINSTDSPNTSCPAQ